MFRGSRRAAGNVVLLVILVMVPGSRRTRKTEPLPKSRTARRLGTLPGMRERYANESHLSEKLEMAGTLTAGVAINLVIRFWHEQQGHPFKSLVITASWSGKLCCWLRPRALAWAGTVRRDVRRHSCTTSELGCPNRSNLAVCHGLRLHTCFHAAGCISLLLQPITKEGVHQVTERGKLSFRHQEFPTIAFLTSASAARNRSLARRSSSWVIVR